MAIYTVVVTSGHPRGKLLKCPVCMTIGVAYFMDYKTYVRTFPTR